jgi:hypothetical protein
MKTHRTLKAGLLCCLLVGMPKLGEAQSLRSAAVGFSYGARPIPDVDSPLLAHACEPNRAKGAAIGALVGTVAGGAVGFLYALSTLLVGPTIPIQAFVVVGGVGGALYGVASTGNCPPN